MPETIRTRRSDLEQMLSSAITVNWEMLAWFALIALTLVTRLWDLGGRAMSHDESLHSYYSWKLFVGEGYRHDPMMHGPLLYHVTALSYFLFGDNDFTARLLPVAASLGLVLCPILVRKWLGRVGALAAGAMFLISPTIMYYSRYIRHDIPVELFTVVMFVSFMQYIDSRHSRWIVIALTAAAGAVTTAEMSYINGFVLVAFIAVALIVERLGPERADAVSIALGALGLGLLIFAAVALTGRLGDVMTKDMPLRTAMQTAFLLGGLGLVYSLAGGLLARFKSEPVGGPAEHAAADVHDGGILADLTVERYFARYSELSAALLPLVSGVIVAALGFVLSDRLGIGHSYYRAARLVFALGLAVTAYGVAAVLFGQLVAALRRRPNTFLVVAGLAVTVLGWALKAVGTAPSSDAAAADAALKEGAAEAASRALGSDAGPAVLVIGVVVLLYGLFGWLLEDFEQRGLARAIGRVPLSAVGVGVAVAAVIYVLLFTTFFTQPDKISGLLDSISYWLEQHEVVRGDQPWYYYGLFTPMYEFLPLALALAAMWVYGRNRTLRVARGNDAPDDANPSPAARLFVPMLVTWSLGNIWIYSWAGEKMPWLIVHLTVPLVLLAARLVADLASAVDWPLMRAKGWQVAGLFVLTAITVVAWMAQQPFGGEMQVDMAATSGWLLGIPVVALLVWALWRVASSVGRRQAQLAIALALAVLLFVLNTRYSLLANFVNDELATEYIVYAHGTPDDKLVFNTLLDMQTRVGVDEGLSIAYDDEVSWPFTWYFRRTLWSDAHYIGKSPSQALTEDVVLVGSPNYSSFEPYLRDRYLSIEYRRMWWPNEGYKGLTRDRFREAIVNPNLRRNWLRILFYREYSQDPYDPNSPPKSLTDWYHHANMRLYVKKDLVARLWPLVQQRPEWAREVDMSVVERPPLNLMVEQRFDTGPDGRPLIAPKGIAVGPDYAVYVVDQGNKRVVVFNEDGTAREAFAEGELAMGTDTKEPSAWGIGLGLEGVVYVADTWNHQIVRYESGRRTTAWGMFGQPAPEDELANPLQFYGPRDVKLGPDDNLYVTDTGNKRISVFTAEGQPIKSFGGLGIEPGKFSEPTSLAFDPATGDLYVADMWNLRIQRFDSDLQPVLEWSVDGWEGTEAAHKAYIAVGPGSIVVASDPQGSRVWVFDSSGTELAELNLPDDPTGLDQPIGVAIDDQGRIYVASSNKGIVTRYAPPDAVLEAAGLAAPAEGAGQESGAEAGGEAAAGEEGAAGAAGEAGAGGEGSSAGGQGAGAGSEGAGAGGEGGGAAAGAGSEGAGSEGAGSEGAGSEGAGGG